MNRNHYLVPACQRANRQNGCLNILFDAKCRVGKAIDEALTSLHMYRDALEVRRTVTTAMLLARHVPVPESDLTQAGGTTICETFSCAQRIRNTSNSAP